MSSLYSNVSDTLKTYQYVHIQSQSQAKEIYLHKPCRMYVSFQKRTVRFEVASRYYHVAHYLQASTTSNSVLGTYALGFHFGAYPLGLK